MTATRLRLLAAVLTALALGLAGVAWAADLGTATSQNLNKTENLGSRGKAAKRAPRGKG